MYADPEPLLNLLHAPRCCDTRVNRLQRQNMLEDLSSELVAPLGAAQSRHQAGETLLDEGSLCVIDSS